MTDLQVVIGRHTLEHPIMNAAGTCKVMEGSEGITEFARSEVSLIMVGSGTVPKKDGNGPGNVLVIDDHGSSNSIGLKNPGIESTEGSKGYKDLLPEMRRVAHDAGKRLGFSGASFNAEEAGVLATVAAEGGVDVYEWNTGCPNIWGEGKQKPITSFRLDMIAEGLYYIKKAVGDAIDVWVKVSYFSDPTAIRPVAGVISLPGNVVAVVVCNTHANSFVFNGDYSKGVDFGKGFGGRGGEGNKADGLGQVMMWKDELTDLKSPIKIIGVSGIATGRDALEYQLCGATGMQLATAFFRAGSKHGIFSDVVSGYVDALEDKARQESYREEARAQLT